MDQAQEGTSRGDVQGHDVHCVQGDDAAGGMTALGG